MMQSNVNLPPIQSILSNMNADTNNLVQPRISDRNSITSQDYQLRSGTSPSHLRLNAPIVNSPITPTSISVTPRGHQGNQHHSIIDYSMYTHTANTTATVMPRYNEPFLPIPTPKENSITYFLQPAGQYVTAQTMTITTPPTSRHNSLPNSPLGWNQTVAAAPPELHSNSHSKTLLQGKCTCNKSINEKFNGIHTHIPRPRNAFILFRQHLHHSLFPKNKELLDKEGSFKTNSNVSREIGQRWRALDEDDKKYWQDLAQKEKEWHKKKYPNYKYTPRIKDGSVHFVRPKNVPL